MLQQYLPLAVLKRDTNWGITALYNIVATVLTACGIETILNFCGLIDFDDLLQQYLPLAVLKLVDVDEFVVIIVSCNSTYRLRYATKGARQQRSKATMRSAHL